MPQRDRDSAPRLRVDDFDYDLPEAAIAQVPVEPRDASRLLVLDRARSGGGAPELADATFHDIGEWLRPGDLLVVNDSRVIPARLRGTRAGGGTAEILALRPQDGEADADTWEALIRPSRRVREGESITLPNGERLWALGRAGEGTRLVRFARDPLQVMADAGEMPLPPYIRHTTAPPDRYQTVYARLSGSAAAPTAGLHFTPGLLAQLEAAGVRRAAVTLHVGLDTFRPLEGEFIDEHHIHSEWYEIPPASKNLLADVRREGGRVVAVGTTSVRVLETAARNPARSSGWTELYITPPHRFSAVDGLVTNFHLPRSSLLLLVTAFVEAGMAQGTAFDARDALLAAYRRALATGYRFFSFGDAMLIV